MGGVHVRLGRRRCHIIQGGRDSVARDQGLCDGRPVLSLRGYVSLRFLICNYGAIVVVVDGLCFAEVWKVYKYIEIYS